jgi:hypothetical protein
MTASSFSLYEMKRVTRIEIQAPDVEEEASMPVQ